MEQKPFRIKRVKEWMRDNAVMLIFLIFTLIGLLISDVPISYFLTDLSSRFFRNAVLVLSLIIPIVAGLGLNFGIVIGAMAGQIAIVIVRFMEIGSLSGLLLALLIAIPLSILFGFFTGKLYNKTKGQEMIASLIVGYFANGLYQFLFLFVVGVIITVPHNHPLIKPDGIGLRATIDLIGPDEGGLKYSLDNIWKVPFVYAVIFIAVIILLLLVIRYVRHKKSVQASKPNFVLFCINIALCFLTIGISLHAILTNSSLMIVGKVPVLTLVFIVLICLLTEFLLSKKIGQDFKSVGQSQHIAEVSGIHVNKTRITAVILSTVIAAWGQIIFLQNMGTLNTFGSHSQVGMFAVASILVGGASTSKATVKQAIFGTLLFNAMFIMSPEIGNAVFGQAILGEYFRTFMVYGVIGVALGLYVWKANRKAKLTI